MSRFMSACTYVQWRIAQNRQSRLLPTEKAKAMKKGESQAFRLSLLRDIYGAEHLEQFIAFEEQVHPDYADFNMTSKKKKK